MAACEADYAQLIEDMRALDEEHTALVRRAHEKLRVFLEMHGTMFVTVPSGITFGTLIKRSLDAHIPRLHLGDLISLLAGYGRKVGGLAFKLRPVFSGTYISRELWDAVRKVTAWANTHDCAICYPEKHRDHDPPAWSR